MKISCWLSLFKNGPLCADTKFEEWGGTRKNGATKAALGGLASMQAEFQQAESLRAAWSVSACQTSTYGQGALDVAHLNARAGVSTLALYPGHQSVATALRGRIVLPVPLSFLPAIRLSRMTGAWYRKIPRCITLVSNGSKPLSAYLNPWCRLIGHNGIEIADGSVTCGSHLGELAAVHDKMLLH